MESSHYATQRVKAYIVDSFADVKNSIPIHVVLTKYGVYAPARSTYSIPCPIHQGQDSNFNVNERKGLWYCFSQCQKGGSVIDLVAALEKIEFKEAAKKLQQEFNISPIHNSIASARFFSNQVDRLKKMKITSQIELPQSRPLEVGYRGLTQEAISFWRLRRTDEGVLIPLISKDGVICSYSLRRDDGKPKYDNAKGFSKCYPYGLWLNKDDIIKEGFVYLVEGQIDAVSMWQHGYKNVVAIMGSQLSEQSAMLILTVTSTLMLVMDGDEPGRKATKEIRQKWGSVFKIGQFLLPDGTDPDEYLEKGGSL
jgi:DNA primase